MLYEAGNDPYRLMFLARLPMILLTLLFGLVVFAFARDLAGPGRPGCWRWPCTRSHPT